VTDKPQTPNFDENTQNSHELGRDITPQDSQVLNINLDKHDQRDDVKKTTWH
jgi:hypothetical protein